MSDDEQNPLERLVVDDPSKHLLADALEDIVGIQKHDHTVILLEDNVKVPSPAAVATLLSLGEYAASKLEDDSEKLTFQDGKVEWDRIAHHVREGTEINDVLDTDPHGLLRVHNNSFYVTPIDIDAAAEAIIKARHKGWG